MTQSHIVGFLLPQPIYEDDTMLASQVKKNKNRSNYHVNYQLDPISVWTPVLTNGRNPAVEPYNSHHSFHEVERKLKLILMSVKWECKCSLVELQIRCV